MWNAALTDEKKYIKHFVLVFVIFYCVNILTGRVLFLLFSMRKEWNPLNQEYQMKKTVAEVEKCQFNNWVFISSYRSGSLFIQIAPRKFITHSEWWKYDERRKNFVLNK